MKILFLVPYPYGNAPSQRYRFEQYFKILEDQGFQLTIAPFIGVGTWKILYKKGNLARKFAGYVFGLIKRLLLLFQVGQYNWIFVHRESIILDPFVYEWVLATLMNKRIIYDFDDAIWIEASSHPNRFFSSFKSMGKTSRICKLSNRVSAGNSFLAQYAKQYNKHVFLIPTTIDTKHVHNILKHHHRKTVVIGWTGSHSTLQYLFEIIPALLKLENNHEFVFKVIADKDPSIPLKSYRFSKWQVATEIDDLLEIDIGLMPLPKLEWTTGKCGLKALQYMSLGIPALVSPVGVNNELITHGVEGYHCHNLDDWFNFIIRLLDDFDLRNRMGEKGREKVIKSYSVEANTNAFLNLFQPKD